MLVLFVEAERRVAGVGPTGVISPVGFWIPRLEVTATRTLEGARTVVSTKEKKRIIPRTLSLKLGDDAADVFIHHLHHCSKHLHTIGLPLAIDRAEAVPRGDVRGAFAERKLFRDEAALELLRITRAAQRIPAAVVRAVPFLHVCLRRVQRVMRRVEGNV